MSREIRRVPPNWEHPTIQEYGKPRDQPMFDENFDDAFARWLNDFARIRADDLTNAEREYWPRGLLDWLADYSPPNPAYYRPWKDEEATWWQLWQTVSEGSPVSPPFATKEELANYLAEHGDFWDQKRGHGGWGLPRAKAFVEAGWAPSMMVCHAPGR
jgi:hypothetical protein